MRFKGLEKFAKWWRHTLELSLWLNILHTLFPGLQNKMNTHASTRWVTKILTRKPKMGNMTELYHYLILSWLYPLLESKKWHLLGFCGDVTSHEYQEQFAFQGQRRRCMCVFCLGLSLSLWLFHRTFISCSKKILCPNTSGIFVSTYNSARYLHLKSLHLKSIDNRVVNTFNRSKVLIKDKYGTTLRF